MTKEPKWNRMAPWNSQTGALVGYVTANQIAQGKIEFGEYKGPIEMRPADTPVQMTLVFQSFERRRSAAQAIWKIKGTNAEVPMFLKDLDEVIKGCRLGNPEVSGSWIVVKRGENYGIRLKT